MKNKYIAGMDEIITNDEFKKNIINAINESVDKKIRRSSICKRVSVISICIGVLLLLFTILPLINANYTSNKTSKHSVISLFNGFVITAYAQDGSHFQVKPNITFLMGKYNMATSSRPGFGFKITCKESDAIRVVSSKGDLLLLSNSRVSNKGRKIDISSNDIIYWSPITKNSSNKIAKSSIISITAYKNHKVIGSAKIKFNADKNCNYSGKLI